MFKIYNIGWFNLGTPFFGDFTVVKSKLPSLVICKCNNIYNWQIITPTMYGSFYSPLIWSAWRNVRHLFSVWPAFNSLPFLWNIFYVARVLCCKKLLTSRVVLMTSRVGMMTSRVGMMTSRVGMITSRVAMMTSRVVMMTSRVVMMTSRVVMMTSRVVMMTSSHVMCYRVATGQCSIYCTRYTW